MGAAAMIGCDSEAALVVSSHRRVPVLKSLVRRCVGEREPLTQRTLTAVWPTPTAGRYLIFFFAGTAGTRRRRIFGQELVVLAGSNDREIDSSFATMAQRQIGALVVTADGFLISRQDQIVALAARYAMPAMYPLSQYIEAGGLMSYGANLPDAFLQTGIYVGRILKGARPADLPVLQPTKVEFVINLKTAKALGIDVPPHLLALADNVIE